MDAPKIQKTAVRYDFLDGLRAILALYVVGHHAWSTVFDYSPQSLSDYFGVFALGHEGVCFFIIVSGFCLVLPTLRHEFKLVDGAGAFFQRRAWRILPPYYFALLFSLILVWTLIHQRTGTHWDVSLPVTWSNIASHVFLVQNLSPLDESKINHVFWSIAVEWQIYFFFPLLLWAWRNLGALYTTLATIFLSLLAETALNHYLHIYPYFHFLGLFAMGMLSAQVSFSSSYKWVPWKLLAVIAFAAFGISTYFPRLVNLSDVFFGCFASAGLIIATLNPAGLLHRCLDFKPLVFVGSFSYSLYLIHAPLLQVLWQYPFASLQSNPNTMCTLLLVVGLPLIVLVAYLFYLAFERPFVRRRNLKTVHVP
jgi:peptidoglycan/LPS O-acetylase OafA/YrhL